MFVKLKLFADPLINTLANITRPPGELHNSVCQRFLIFLVAFSLALVIDTRASINLKTKHKKQNCKIFAIIQLFNNTSRSPPSLGARKV